MQKWVHISEVTPKVEEYLDLRRKGLIKSLRTGFYKLDASNIGGFEWRSTIIIGGRPSVGKSAFSECMIRGFIQNNEPDFDILDFTWEMSPEVILRRNLSTDMQRSYRYVCSAQNNQLTDQEMTKVSSLLKDKYSNLPIYYVEKPDTVKGFIETIKKFRDERKDRKIVVRVDHTILAKISKDDGGDRVTMLLNLLGESNELKKESDMIFLFLTQIKREFELRQKSGTNEAYPLQSDAYASDSVAFYSETMILLNRPAMFKIDYYGKRPTGIQVDRHDMFAHVVKSRNSEPNLMIRFREDFENMNVYEA